MTNTTISDIVRYADKTARERNVKWMDTTILLKSLLWSASEAYRILQRGGLGYSEDNPDYLARFDRELVRFDNEPLEEGEKPRFTPVALRLVEHANSPLALLRAMQHTDCEGNLILKEHWIWPPNMADGRAGGTRRRSRILPFRPLLLLLRKPETMGQGEANVQGEVAGMGAAHARSHTQRNGRTMLNINGVNIEYQYDGAHDARPTEHTLHGLDGLNLSGLDWMRLSHVCRLMAARDRKPERTFVRVSGWTADRPNMRLIMDVIQDDDGTDSVPLPLTSDCLLVDSAECDNRCQYGWLSVLEQLPEHVDYGRLDETGMQVVDWLNGMADPSPEIFEDWEAISLIRQNVYEDEPTELADLLRSTTRTERDECFEMLEQVETGRPL